mmetsp:Transcript_32727/g.78742  ORF Transcript_32727/g.78742 Transcript_32727/m.78742 type:complete len:217 (-) Transcript_32727:1242-1892(-)
MRAPQHPMQLLRVLVIQLPTIECPQRKSSLRRVLGLLQRNGDGRSHIPGGWIPNHICELKMLSLMQNLHLVVDGAVTEDDVPSSREHKVISFGSPVNLGKVALDPLKTQNRHLLNLFRHLEDDHLGHVPLVVGLQYGKPIAALLPSKRLDRSLDVNHVDRNILVMHAEDSEACMPSLLGLGQLGGLHSQKSSLGLPDELSVGDIEQIPAADNHSLL